MSSRVIDRNMILSSADTGTITTAAHQIDYKHAETQKRSQLCGPGSGLIASEQAFRPTLQPGKVRPYRPGSPERPP